METVVWTDVWIIIEFFWEHK